MWGITSIYMHCFMENIVKDSECIQRFGPKCVEIRGVEILILINSIGLVAGVR
jgi:hypothetical protein